MRTMSGTKANSVIVESNLAISLKRKNETEYVPATPLLGTHLAKTQHICKRMSTRMFTAALFIIVKN